MAEKTFKLGLCMAGAISAGAYSAGVLDYLFETLQIWEEEKEKIRNKEKEDKTVPMHDVVIEVLNGTSAGGMCAAIAASELLCDKQINFGSSGVNNRLYDAWVNLNDNVGKEETIKQMLDVSDISAIMENDENNQKKGVRALFNSDFIVEICDRIITKAPLCYPQRKFVSENLDIAVTVTNLRGIPYSIKFNHGMNTLEHKMPNYSHYLHFNLNPAQGSSATKLDTNNGKHIQLLKEAAMATGAFPIGLESRETELDTILINQIKFPVTKEILIPECNKKILTEEQMPIRPAWPYGMGNKLNILCVDGGMVNNEPFNFTHKLLLEKTPGRTYNPRGKDDVDNAIIMIDPFPNFAEPYPLDYKYSKKLLSVIGQIYSALRNQPLFRKEDIMLALDEEIYSRYLIVPTRSIHDGYHEYPIACGSLDGFGGFLDKGFREHDYKLGRRNCQQFLRRHFAIPADNNNPIFATWSDEAKARFTFTENGVKYIPIIPDLKTINAGEPEINPTEAPPNYPIYDKKEKFPVLKEKLKTRLVAIIKDVISNAELLGNDSDSFLKKSGWFFLKFISILLLTPFLVIGIPIYFIIKNKMVNSIIDIIEKDLTTRKLIR